MASPPKPWERNGASQQMSSSLPSSSAAPSAPSSSSAPTAAAAASTSTSAPTPPDRPTSFGQPAATTSALASPYSHLAPASPYARPGGHMAAMAVSVVLRRLRRHGLIRWNGYGLVWGHGILRWHGLLWRLWRYGLVRGHGNGRRHVRRPWDGHGTRRHARRCIRQPAATLSHTDSRIHNTAHFCAPTFNRADLLRRRADARVHLYGDTLLLLRHGRCRRPVRAAPERLGQRPRALRPCPLAPRAPHRPLRRPGHARRVPRLCAWPTPRSCPTQCRCGGPHCPPCEQKTAHRVPAGHLRRPTRYDQAHPHPHRARAGAGRRCRARARCGERRAAPARPRISHICARAVPIHALKRDRARAQRNEIVAVMGKLDPRTGAEVDPRIEVPTAEWWRGRTREGREGWFPRKWVEVLERRKEVKEAV
ncbi:hypothetical protein BD779DRAFT_1554809 [Infundibulicybe gibba]|nr:hypothetical protein BD779DRAFT_1554809 [Infundibulicybe gibba]